MEEKKQSTTKRKREEEEEGDQETWDALQRDLTSKKAKLAEAKAEVDQVEAKCAAHPFGIAQCKKRKDQVDALCQLQKWGSKVVDADLREWLVGARHNLDSPITFQTDFETTTGGILEIKTARGTYSGQPLTIRYEHRGPGVWECDGLLDDDTLNIAVDMARGRRQKSWKVLQTSIMKWYGEEWEITVEPVDNMVSFLIAFGGGLPDAF